MARMKVLTTVRLNLEKETKNAVRYHEVDGDGAFVENFNDGQINTVYLRKNVFADENWPESIEVVVRS